MCLFAVPGRGFAGLPGSLRFKDKVGGPRIVEVSLCGAGPRVRGFARQFTIQG
jgi:hypothetical protein